MVYGWGISEKVEIKKNQVESQGLQKYSTRNESIYWMDLKLD